MQSCPPSALTGLRRESCVQGAVLQLGPWERESGLLLNAVSFLEAKEPHTPGRRSPSAVAHERLCFFDAGVEARMKVLEQAA